MGAASNTENQLNGYLYFPFFAVHVHRVTVCDVLMHYEMIKYHLKLKYLLAFFELEICFQDLKYITLYGCPLENINYRYILNNKQ